MGMEFYKIQKKGGKDEKNLEGGVEKRESFFWGTKGADSRRGISKHRNRVG